MTAGETKTQKKHLESDCSVEFPIANHIVQRLDQKFQSGGGELTLDELMEGARKDGRDVVLKLLQTRHWAGYMLVHALRVFSWICFVCLFHLATSCHSKFNFNMKPTSAFVTIEDLPQFTVSQKPRRRITSVARVATRFFFTVVISITAFHWGSRVPESLAGDGHWWGLQTGCAPGDGERNRIGPAKCQIRIGSQGQARKKRRTKKNAVENH